MSASFSSVSPETSASSPGTPGEPPRGWAEQLRPFVWVPSLYLAMGIPFNVIMGGTAARMYKSLGYSDGQITVALGSIGVAWSLKPLWAAFLDMYRTKKFFVLSMEVLIMGLLAAIALTLPAPGFFQISIGLLWVAAFASSTQDICADGIYLTALNKSTQAKLAGVQGMFWILGKLLATGGVIWAMDAAREQYGWTNQFMWVAVFGVCAAIMGVLAIYHFFLLPAVHVTERPESIQAVWRDFLGTGETFFHKRAFWGMIAFVFLYRLGEGLILMEGQLFLQSAKSVGGMGLSAGQVSSIDAIWGTLASVVGGILGGMLISRVGLMKCLGILGLCLNIPHLTYLVLSQAAAGGHGASYGFIVTMVSIEKFGYGFGFVGNMVYMMQQLAPGRATMTHYAFATALMNLMLIPTNMISGPLAEKLGFATFFLVVMVASVPSIWAAFKAPFPRRADRQAGGDATAALLTADDPSQLSAVEIGVQRIAGRASIFAMLHVLMLLLADAKILGSLQGKEPGAGKVQFGWLMVSAAVKLFLTWRALAAARQACAEGHAAGETVYVGNARGARITTYVCLAAGALVLAFGAKFAFGS